MIASFHVVPILNSKSVTLTPSSYTYHLLPVTRIELLFAYHFLDRSILHHLSLFLSPDQVVVFLALHFPIVRLRHLLILFHLIILINSCSTRFFFLLIFYQSVLLLSLSHLSELVLAHTIFFISLSNLHNLLSLSFRLLDLLPSLLFLHFKECNTIS